MDGSVGTKNDQIAEALGTEDGVKYPMKKEERHEEQNETWFEHGNEALEDYMDFYPASDRDQNDLKNIEDHIKQMADIKDSSQAKSSAKTDKRLQQQT